MPRVAIQHAGALACALAAFLLIHAFVSIPLAVSGLGAIAALVVGYGVCAARRNPVALVPAMLALAGIAMLASVVAAPASPTVGRLPTLTAIAAPAPSLVVAPPVLPAAQPQLVVKVSETAPADTSVAVPINDWLAVARNTIITVLLGLWAMSKNKLPRVVVWAVSAYGERKLIEAAVGFAINAIPGVARGVPLSIPVGNRVLARAVQWIVDTVPGFVVTMLGGEEGIRSKVFAALHLEGNASAGDFGVVARR